MRPSLTEVGNIPAALKTRDQWLHWDSDNNTPRRPHNCGDFGVSWSDPDAWMSFDQAKEALGGQETWGLGYVTAVENDDLPEGIISVIDLDDAADANDELAEWVPPLDPFIDRGCYIEWSPSHKEDGPSGLHIPVVGHNIPEWWSDSHIDGEHAGADLLRNKFCTVTGDVYEGAGDNLAKYEPWLVDWLEELYTSITGDDPSEEQSEDTGGRASRTTSLTRDSVDYDDEWLTVERAEEALDHINPGCSYDKWRNIGFALADHFDSHTAKSLFEQWSRGSRKYDKKETPRLIEDITSRGSGGVSIGTLVHFAKEGGWSLPVTSSWADREFGKYVEQKTDGDSRLSGKEVWELWSDARSSGKLGSSSTIPEIALEFVARDRGYYNFDELPEEADELPPKAHNRALWWIKNSWADEHLSEDSEPTATRYKPKDECVFTWEDIRYIYDEDKLSARSAAEGLLRRDYDFMTVSETEQLHVYDSEKGVYTTRLSAVRSELHRELGEYWTTHESNEILARLRQTPRPEMNDLNAGSIGEFDTPHICVKNGVLDLFNQELKEHSPDYYFVDRVPVRYDPEADREPYESFLDDITNRPEDKLSLLEMVGHALTPTSYEIGWKKFLILTGDTNNGKSVFFSRVQSLLNGPESEESNTANVKLSKIAQNRFSNNSMLGKLANIAGEIDGKKIRNTGAIKDITGGDSVEIEPKGKDSFFAPLNSTFMFAANDPPIIGERDKAAVASRIVPVNLPYTFVNDPSGPLEKQKVPESVLREELDSDQALSGFLNLALDGISRLIANHGDVSLPESESERLRMYERAADPMREFGERCLVNTDEDYLVKADVTTIYKEFAADLGHDVGSNVDRTLHNVLRGSTTLNYTDSRPRSPDYTDTSMPLRGWDERKTVINRVKLTEEGLKYAESAGLIEEEDEQKEEEKSVFDSVPIERAAESLTGYVTVTAEIVSAQRIGNGDGVKAILKDNTSPIDIVAWDVYSADKLVDLEGQTVAIIDAKVGEFEGARQLKTVEGLTTIKPIQRGVGYTTAVAPDVDQDSLTAASEAAETDGGSDQLEARVLEWLRTQTGSGDSLSVPSIAGELGVPPSKVERVLDRISQTRSVIESRGDGEFSVL